MTDALLCGGARWLSLLTCAASRELRPPPALLPLGDPMHGNTPLSTGGDPVSCVRLSQEAYIAHESAYRAQPDSYSYRDVGNASGHKQNPCQSAASEAKRRLAQGKRSQTSQPAQPHPTRHKPAPKPQTLEHLRHPPAVRRSQPRMHTRSAPPPGRGRGHLCGDLFPALLHARGFGQYMFPWSCAVVSTCLRTWAPMTQEATVEAAGSSITRGNNCRRCSSPPDHSEPAGRS